MRTYILIFSLSTLISKGIIGQDFNRLHFKGSLLSTNHFEITDTTLTAKFSIFNQFSDTLPIWSEINSIHIDSKHEFEIILGTISNLQEVEWSLNDKFIKCEILLDYFFSTISFEQLTSSPFAIKANTAILARNGIAPNPITGDTILLNNNTEIIIPGLAAANNLPEPRNNCHTCGALNVHNDALTYGTMFDQEGNQYKTIQIGTQIWMAENLKTIIYRNGDSISSAIINGYWTTDVSEGRQASLYNIDGNLCPYGRLYNHLAVIDDRALCPLGWHVPSFAEFTSLIYYLDPRASVSPLEFVSSSSAGKKLRSVGAAVPGPGFWNGSSTGIDNVTGFSALPSGYGSSNGYHSFWSVGSAAFLRFAEGGYFNINGGQQGLQMVYDSNGFFHYQGYAIRCLKD